MFRILQGRGGRVFRVGTGATVKPMTRPVRMFRIFYALLSSGFVVCILVQVFFAGMGAFGADWSYHVTFGHLLEPLPMLMIPVAFVGRLSWALRLPPLLLIILIGAQYALASAAVPAAALHPVNAVLILLIGLFLARRAWTTVAWHGKV